MKTDNIPNMVAAIPHKRSVGRPRKFAPRSLRCSLILPAELVNAGEQFRRNRGLLSLTDAMRELMREAAEARGLLDSKAK